MAGVNSRQLTMPQWLGIGAGLVALIASFLPWWSASIDAMGISASESRSAWGVGALGWLAVVLLVVAAVIVAMPLFGSGLSKGPITWLVLSVLALVMIVIRLLTYDASADIPERLEAMDGFSTGASFGTYLGLIAAIASAVGAFLAFRDSRSTSAA